MNFTEDYVAAFLGETGKFQLVTCDGSFDCTDNPGNQEATVYPLILQSWKVAMKCLQNNGCAIIKIYTLFSQDMLNFMNQFCPMFESVFLHKPAASKPGNSEVYLIGIKFRETDVVEPAGNDLRFSVYEAARYFARHQIEAINFNLSSFSKLTQYQRSAIDIKKKEIKARVKLKIHFYQEYRQLFYKPASVPIVFTPEWPLDLMSSFVITNETLSSIVRSNYVVLALRASRMALLDPYRVSLSMFADYKLMEFAQDVGLGFYDMCCVRKTPSFRRLRYNFLLQGSDLLVDSLFTSRSDWLELCYYAAHQRISPENIFPNSNLAILLSKPATGFTVDNIRICLNYGSSLILSRFSASVIFFLSMFFSEVVFDKNEIRFSKRKKSSEEYSSYIRQLALNIPSTQDVVQFVPLCFFTNYCIYSKVLTFNNQGLHDLLQKEEDRQRQFMEESVN
ncbi:Cap-specific mRNA (nucleoside-2'-O-)-methyltransferase 2 [Aphelenchoides bicaudatus]|nr:Cap-specific mRNA (nucleoside-2'-O-)-methyltransferase 2 [Aphelenchoides bicaudatus]